MPITALRPWVVWVQDDSLVVFGEPSGVRDALVESHRSSVVLTSKRQAPSQISISSASCPLSALRKTTRTQVAQETL